MAREVNNYSDVLDSRDVIARRDELRAEIDDLMDTLRDAVSFRDEAALERPDIIHVELENVVTEAHRAVSDWNDVNKEELDALTALCEEGEQYASDWEYGETLIRYSYFEDYARQFAEDIGAVSGMESWPQNCIDWEKAARELKYDYTAISFDGVDYYVRNS